MTAPPSQRLADAAIAGDPAAPAGCPPEGWVRLNEDLDRVEVWRDGAWRELPPPVGTPPGLWKTIAWKLGRDGELP